MELFELLSEFLKDKSEMKEVIEDKKWQNLHLLFDWHFREPLLIK